MKNYNLPIPGVYRIIAPDGRSYVGSSSNMAKRFSKYRNAKCERQPKLHESLLKFGFDSHHIEILAYCPKDELTTLERKYGEEYEVCGPRGLNMALPSDDSGKMLLSDEYREKLESRTMDEETRRKISETISGRVLTEEHKQKIAEAQTGRTHSSETRQKQSDRKKGRYNHWSKKVRHLQSGVVYDTIDAAAWATGMVPSTLARHLRLGTSKDFEYATENDTSTDKGGISGAGKALHASRGTHPRSMQRSA